MFIINSIQLENFMSVDSMHLEFSPNQITAITGPNGAGKSTILNAIAFAVTGYRQGESSKDYVRIGCEKAHIHMEATFKGYPLSYDIDIYNSSKNPKVTSRTVVYNGRTYINSDYNQFMEEHRMEDLESLMFMFQGTNSIIESKPAERASLLKKLFKFEFPEIVDTLRTRMDQEKMEVVEYNAILSELNSRRYDRLPLLREVAPINITRWEGRIEEINRNLSLIGDTNEDEISSCERELASCRESLARSMKSMKEDEKSLEKARNHLSKVVSSLESMDIESLTLEADRTRTEQSEHEKEYALQQAEYSNLKSELDVLSYRERELSEQYRISLTGVCHACGQPIEKSHMENLSSSLDSTRRKMEELKKRMDGMGFDPRDSKRKEIGKRLSSLEESIKKYSIDMKTRESLETRVDDLSRLLSERQNTVSQLERKAGLLEEERKNLAEMEGLIKEKNNLVREREEIQGKLRTCRENSIKNNERREANRRLEEDMKVRDSRIRELTEKINSTSMDLTVVKKELDIFEKEFPNFIVLNACQHLEDVINEIVQRVFPYCRISLKLSKGGMNFFYTPENSDGGWVPVSMASGAQKMLIALSYFISLARLSGMSCIFLDEIDASCSAENSKLIYEFISKINLFEQVFFITHRPESIDIVKETNPNVKVLYVENGEYEEM